MDISTTTCEVKLCPSLQQQQVDGTFNQPVYSHKILIITKKHLKLCFQLYWILLGKIWEMCRPFGNNIIKHSVPKNARSLLKDIEHSPLVSKEEPGFMKLISEFII